MKKIISLFQRNYDGDRLVRDEIVPGAEWVQAGEGIATRKWDGTCVMIRGGKLFKRYDCKKGKTPPPNFEPAMEADPVTGHQTGWLPVGEEKDSWMHREAYNVGFGFTDLIPNKECSVAFTDGTWELCGPGVNKNPEGCKYHILIRHGDAVASDAPRTFNALKEWFSSKSIEGVVWHHPDGRMVKIKKRDFGLTR